MFLKRTWAKIDLDALKHNYHAIKSIVSEKSKICSVVKADGYGHGAVYIAKTLVECGCENFAVSNIEEAEQLRKAKIDKNILILGKTDEKLANKLAKLDLVQTVFSLSYAKKLNEKAKSYNVTIPIHIKLDTGMGRLGFLYNSQFMNEEEKNASINDILKLKELNNLEIEGIFTHFVMSDEGEDGKKLTNLQFSDYEEATKKLENFGFDFKIKHVSNSGATLDFAEYNLDMVRPGIILYGLYPSSKVKNKINLVPVMELYSSITMIKTLKEGACVSYGSTYRCQKDTVVATVPIGYADGFIRAIADRGYMIVHGKKAKIIGRICMDQLMLDISDIKASEGDEVLIFGKDENSQTIEDVAKSLFTINYEVCCIIGKRVPRIYIKDNKQIGRLNYILS